MFSTNALLYGDNLAFLRGSAHFPDNSVDLIYLDPPFNSNRDYNILFPVASTTPPAAQLKAFNDTWHWDESAERILSEMIADRHTPPRCVSLLQSLERFLGRSGMLAYCVQMAARLVHLRRILKETGSLYLHCDCTAAHYLKLVLDSIFGPENFLNNVVWLYGLGGSSSRYWPKKHDDLLWYSKSPDRHYFVADKIPATSQKMKGELKKAPDYWDIPTINNMSHERLGYPTQKPMELLRRVVRSSCPPDGVVLDPFCGGGTTLDATEELNRSTPETARKWIGIDITHLSINLVKYRLSRYSPACSYRLVGEPVDSAGAAQLFADDPLQFQYWACGLVGALPLKTDPNNSRRAAAGSDAGLDGIRFFRVGAKNTERIVVQVKGGAPTLSEVRDFCHVVGREKAAGGLFVMLKDPTDKMRAEAAGTGMFSDSRGNAVPRVQLVTIDRLLRDGTPRSPGGVALPVDAVLDSQFVALPIADDGSLFISR